MHGTYGGPGMKTRKDGTKPTTHGPGPKTPSMPPRGPGSGQARKAGIAPGRHVENKRNK
jgi:hypothetical protein